MKIRNEVPLYEKKIKELHSELELATKQVGEEQQKRDELKSEISFLEKQKSLVSEQIPVIQGEIDRLELILSSRAKEVRRIDAEISEKQLKSGHESSEHIRKISGLKDEVKQHTSKLGELKQLTGQIEGLIREKTELLTEIGDAHVKLSKLVDEREQTEKEIEKQKQDMRDYVISVNKAAQQNAIDRGKIELYAKRLQKYYDDTGVNLKILKVFNIETL